MGERLLCKQEVVGSIPSASTRWALLGLWVLRLAASWEVQGLCVEGWVTAVGRGLALGV